MPRLVKRLSALKVKKIEQAGWYPDGAGLYLQVSPTLTKSWVYRYSIDGRERRHGLGSTNERSLEQARHEAQGCAQMRREGLDPIDACRQEKSRLRLDRAAGVTFQECAERYIGAHEPSWRNAKHGSQWRNTLSTYAFPVFSDVSVKDIEVGLVLRVIEPLWETRTETATRVRQRIEAILDWAKVRGYRDGENPARWRGHLDKLLPARAKVQKVRHFTALPYREMPEFFAWLCKKESVAANAVAFLILTATRSGEARQAVDSEICLETNVWSIPGERMKAGRAHRVPLSESAIAVLNRVEPLRFDERIFPGLTTRPISDSALLKVAKEYRADLTVHGFRSSFRDWCAEVTNFPREVAEAALAHSIKNQAEAAYQRGDLLTKRAELMNAWASYCTGCQR